MTGRLMRTFPMIVEVLTEEQRKTPKSQSIVWPMLKWSPDEKYVGRVTPGQHISIYEVPSMGLLGKKSLKIEGVQDFEWAPLSDKERDELEDEAMGKPKTGKPGPARENIIAFWTPEMQNQPARVTLMSLPSRIPIRSKNLFNVHDVRSSFYLFPYFPSSIVADLASFPRSYSSLVQDPLAIERRLPLRQGRSSHQDKEDSVLQPRAVPSAR